MSLTLLKLWNGHRYGPRYTLQVKNINYHENFEEQLLL